MSQGGWRDPRSALRYAHTVTKVQRAAVDALPIGGPQEGPIDTSLTRPALTRRKSQ